jgi:type VI secretion system secreted protein Hcp
MPGNAFIRFQTQSDTFAPGESLQEGHAGRDGWVEIGDWSWDVEADTSFTKGTGAAVGKPVPGTLSISHYYDKSSPVIMQNILMGTHFKAVRIDMLKQTGDAKGKPAVYFQLNANDVFITKVSSKGGEDGTVSQDIEMVFKGISMGYKRQDNTGKLDGTSVDFHWNVAAMSEATLPAIKVDMK